MAEAKQVDLLDNALLRGIPPDRLREAGIHVARTTFAAGDVIFEESSSGDCCFLVESGLVRISKASGDGSHETLGFINPGEFFGELAVFYSAPRSARATAVSATSVGQLDRHGFERLRAEFPLELTAAIANAGLDHLRELHAALVQQLGDADRFQKIGVGVGVIAHDLRNPLGTIKLAADLILGFVAEGETDATKLVKYVEIIRRTSVDAIKSANHLLAEVRGEQATERVLAPISEIVQEASERMLGLLGDKKVQFETLVQHEGSLWCERSEFVRALVNVLRNGVEALPEEGGRVMLHVTGDESEVVFAISDTGHGIPPEFHGRIFERRFSRGKAGGTGLGLDQVRKVVERHGGRIFVESQVGEGTTFRIRIPTRRADRTS